MVRNAKSPYRVSTMRMLGSAYIVILHSSRIIPDLFPIMHIPENPWRQMRYKVSIVYNSISFWNYIGNITSKIFISNPWLSKSVNYRNYLKRVVDIY